MESCFGNNKVMGEMEMANNYTSFGECKSPRSCTNKISLICMGVFFVLLFSSIVITLVNGDISRLINGFDDCGNVCGKSNHGYKDNCFGKDMTNKKFLLAKLVISRYSRQNHTTRECVQNCKQSEGFSVLYLNRCFIKAHNSKEDVDFGGSFWQNVSEDLQQVWGYIILMSLLALVFSIIAVILLRHITSSVVWFTLIGMPALLIGGTIFLFILYKNASDKSEKSNYSNDNEEDVRRLTLYLALSAVVVCCIMGFVIFVFFKRIKLVIQIFQEAAKAVAAMPILISQPIWTFCALFVIFVCGCYFSMWITSYAYLAEDDRKPGYRYNNPDATYIYKQTTMSSAIFWLNWFGILWMVQFVIGCQHLIVGGCVATWFFSRDKENLVSPIISNTKNLVKYHLGTVAIASITIAIIEVPKQLLRCLRQAVCHGRYRLAVLIYCLFGGVLESIEADLKFFSKNLYIMTAIYGHPFCQGGKEAFRLLIDNVFLVVEINAVANYVLIFLKLIIVFFTTLIGYETLQTKELHSIWFTLTIIGIIAFYIAHCFIIIYGMAIDTILLCFCKDYELNNGLSKPYYMSRNVMEYVENSCKVMERPWDGEQLQAWENGPKRILQQDS